MAGSGVSPLHASDMKMLGSHGAQISDILRALCRGTRAFLCHLPLLPRLSGKISTLDGGDGSGR